MDLEAIRRFRDRLLRRHEAVDRVVLQRRKNDRLLATVGGHDADRERSLRIRAQHRHLPAGAKNGRVRFDRLASRHLHRLTAGRRHFPDVTAIDVARVGAIEQVFAVGRQADVLHHAVARREHRRRFRHAGSILRRAWHAVAGRRRRRYTHRVIANPLFWLRLKDDVIGVSPLDCIHIRELAIVRRIVPELVGVAGRRIRDPERERVATLERG